MKKRTPMWICTLLGTAAGVALTWFLSLQSETTFEMWIDELFVQRRWDCWAFLATMILVPTFVGLAVGVMGNGFARFFWTPIVSAAAGFAGMLILTLTMVLWEQREIYGVLALILLGAALTPPSYIVVVAIIKKN